MLSSWDAEDLEGPTNRSDISIYTSEINEEPQQINYGIPEWSGLDGTLIPMGEVAQQESQRERGARKQRRMSAQP